MMTKFNVLIILLVVAFVSFVTANPAPRLTPQATLVSFNEGVDDENVRKIRSFPPKAREDDDDANNEYDDSRRPKRHSPPKVIPDEELEEDE